mgnify:CR=1 FL=1
MLPDYHIANQEIPSKKWDKAYRFGFNGQEKVNEIAGIGNYNSALFWEYDTRLARRWNLDPRNNISNSPYSAFANSPVYLSDYYGDTTIAFNNKGEELGTINDNLENQVHFFNIDVETGKAMVSQINNLSTSDRNTYARFARGVSTAFISKNSINGTSTPEKQIFGLKNIANNSVALKKEIVFLAEYDISRELMFNGLKVPPDQKSEVEADPYKVYDYNEISLSRRERAFGDGHTHTQAFLERVKNSTDLHNLMMLLGTPTNSTQWDRSKGNYNERHDYKNHLGSTLYTSAGGAKVYKPRTTPLFIGSPLGISIYNKNSSKGQERIISYDWFK